MEAEFVVFFLIIGSIVSLIIFNGFITVKPREGVVVLSFGSFAGTIDSEGIHWVFPTGRRLKRIPRRKS